MKIQKCSRPWFIRALIASIILSALWILLISSSIKSSEEIWMPCAMIFLFCFNMGHAENSGGVTEYNPD
jgi:4-amino-4-deoxy-L-arabinose transferase-like glycosyltransferase